MRLATLVLLLAPLASAQTAHFSDRTSTIEVSGETQIGTVSTYEAVIYFPADTGTSGIIYNEWTNGTEDKLLQLNFSTAGPSVLVGYGFPNGPGVLLGEAVVSGDAWHHIAYVYDGAEERHYLDGVLIGSRPQSGDVSDGAGLARLGAIARDGNVFRSFAGYLDALRISDVARYSGPSFTPPIDDLPSDDDTILLFNFNEPAGSSTLQDESPLGRTGTLGVGFAGATAPTLGGMPVASAPSPDDALDLTLAPNPTRGELAVRFGVREAGPVRVALYDALGREVRVLASGPMRGGSHEVGFDGSRLPAGVYLVRLEAGGEVQARAVTLAR